MWIKILLVFFAFSFLFRTDLSFDQDLGRHIKLGEIIIAEGQVPKTNLFSYTNPNFPFINTHWLFEVLVYGFDQTVGLEALLILKIIIILTAVWITLKVIPQENRALLLPIGFIFLHVLRERLELRPEIFSFLFTALTYYILEKFTSSLRASGASVAISQNNQIAQSGTPRNHTGYKLIFLLPIIQLIWINTHIYFFVGLILQAIYLIHLGYEYLRSQTGFAKIKLMGVIFILSVFVSLINPNGLQGLLYPLNVTKNYGYSIVENQTMSFLESIDFRDPNFLFVKLTVAIILFSIIIAILSSLRRQGSNKNILFSLSGLILALMHVRSFPYLVFLSLPAVMQNFGEIKRNNWTRILSLVVCILLLFESFFYLNGDYYRFRDDQHQVKLGYTESVKGAMNFVLKNNLPQPIFNNFDIGSYVLYRGYPKYRVFVDGRPEAYPSQFFSGIYIPGQADYNNFKELEKLYGLKTIIFSHTDQTPWAKTFLNAVIKDESWNLVYVDDFMITLVKSETAKDLQLKLVDLATLNPNSYQFDNHISYLRLGVFLLSNQYQNGVSFIQKSLQINPHSPVANAILGNPQKNYFFW